MGAVEGGRELGAPFWVADCEIAFDREASRAGRTVAVIESIVFLLRANLDALRTVGPEPSRIVVGGGLSRLEGLCQRLADLGNLPVERVANPEATAQGLAWLLRHNPLSPDKSPAPAKPTGSTRRFVPANNPRLHARYRAWRAWLDGRINAHRD